MNYGNFLVVETAVVEMEYRREGIGKALIQAVPREMAAHGVGIHLANATELSTHCVLSFT